MSVVMTLVGVGSILVLVNLILLRGRRFLLSLIILLVELVLSFPWDPLPSFKQAILPYFLPSTDP